MHALLLAAALLAPQSPGTDIALEDLLRQARASAEERAKVLEPSLLEVVERVEKLKGNQPKELASARADLVRLGREIAVRLVPLLDPGARDDDGTRRRAALVRDVLRELRSQAALPALIALADAGPPTPRRHALAVLGTSADRATAQAALARAARDPLAPIRAAALVALAELGGDAAQALVRDGLADPDPEVLRAVLVALAALDDTGTASAIAALLAEARARGAAREALAYYRAHVELASPLVCQRLLALAAHSDVALDARLAILDAVPAFHPPWDADLRKTLEPAVASGDDKLRFEALVCLARLGDKGARKDLKREQDDYVNRNSGWAQAFASRARLLLRLEEYDLAQRDFKKALELYDKSNRNLGEERECRVGLARAYALDKRLKDAGTTLEQAGLTPDELKKLAQDPDFAELAANAKWGKILQGW